MSADEGIAGPGLPGLNTRETPADRGARRYVLRVVGRILMVLVSLPVLLAGTVGLLMSYLPDSSLTDGARQALHAAVGLVSSDRGLAIGLDGWLVFPALRFGLAPTGLVLLLAGLLAGGGGGEPTAERGQGQTRKGKGKKGRGDGKSESAPEVHKTTAVEKRFLKKAEKQAQMLARKGEVQEAAELLFDVGALDKAADYFVQAGSFVRAAEIRHDQNRFVESAELYLRAGRHESAGSIFAQQEEFDRAAECYEAIGSTSVAAEMYEKGGNMRQAAKCYKQADFLRHAAAAYVKCKDWLAAAECLEQVYGEESLRNKGDAKFHQELMKLVLQAGKLFRRAEQPQKALEILERGGCFTEAAELALGLQQFAKAAELFQDASLPERAAEALRSMGEDEEAARILAAVHRDRGETKEAAECFEQAGDNLAAGDLYRSLEAYGKAGDCFMRARDYLAAAEMYSLAEDGGNAAACFEKAEKFREAAACRERLGQRDKQAELLERAGDFLLSGQVFHGEGLDDEAIKVLQKVPPESEGFSKASAMSGRHLPGTRAALARDQEAQQAIGDRELDRDSIPIYY